MVRRHISLYVQPEKGVIGRPMGSVSTFLALFLLLMGSASPSSRGQQIAVNRVEQMPNMPAPYEMRNWKQVAIGYDGFVFDLDRTGMYLPLIWINTSTVNYPEHDSFGLETVVGTPRFHSGEAINVLPALVGASLVGIDKSNQNGSNWVMMAEEFFNRRPEENVYLNLPVTSSGDDWWYETMPNVFFYQLYDLYRYPEHPGDFESQFTTVADRFLEAVETMGGKSAPWAVPNMNYRAFSFPDMKPLLTGVKEPEAAGAIAWLLYNAYAETGDKRYRVGAEWAMGFLNGRTTNPAYEIQLPYGVYAAARMNAELNTSYDVEKMVNWTFDVGPLRSWGSLLGTWGGYDVHGLIGEESSNDYAFMMNGYQQAGALVPMTRYDDRFARAIGKWILNLANASRLFYPKYLPATNQDSEDWAFEYDPESYIGHEAIRQNQNGQSPYATGDAIAGGWGHTNLALYGSSHVGMLGGIIDTTDVEGILKLDLLKTDFFHAEAYRTYLYYNPHEEDKIVTVDVGPGSFDLYDAVSNEFVLKGASGNVQVAIPADEAAMLVLAPAGGAVTYEGNKTLIEGVVVDFGAGLSAANTPPHIKALDATSREVFSGDSVAVYCTAEDKDSDPLTYKWEVSGGHIFGEGTSVTYTPLQVSSPSVFFIYCTVDDGRGGTQLESLDLTVFANHRPVISELSVDPPITDVGGSATATCEASDEDGDPLTYHWEVDGGTITGEGSTVSWTGPEAPGYFTLHCIVEDDELASTEDSAGVAAGDLVGYYPFNGNAADESGFGNNATVDGPVLVSDRDGVPSAAFAFDGIDDVVTVPSHPSLDFQGSITVAFWMKPYQLFNREAFLVSHGSWQNRWKVSITPEHRLRWTVKTVSSIKDLDAGTVLKEDSVYSVAVTYDGSAMKIFVKGRLDGQVAFSGLMTTTSLDVTLGQMLPGNKEWNFNGEIDDVRIYNRALSEEEVAELVGVATSIDGPPNSVLPGWAVLHPNYPNPFFETTTIPFDVGRPGRVAITVFDLMGRRLCELFSGDVPAGKKSLVWDGRDDVGRRVSPGLYFIRLEQDGHVTVVDVVRTND